MCIRDRGDTVGYRDDRTKGMDEKVYQKISPEDLYALSLIHI